MPKQKNHYDVIKGKKVRVTTGLLPHVEDKRDFKVKKLMGAFFGLLPYIPKSDDIDIDTLDVKDQYPFNTCGWNSVTSQKQVDEQTILSVRGAVTLGRAEGLVTGDGLSTLRGNQMIAQKYGIPDVNAFPELRTTNFEEYANTKLLTPAVKENALQYKSGSFFQVKTEDEILKCLDDGRVMETGMDWYTGYFARYGFNKEAIIDKTKGQNLGGHAFLLKGWKKNYHGYRVLKFITSYTADYGDRGCFYVPVEFALNNCYAFYTQVDMPKDIASLINQYGGKFVKVEGKSGIYLIDNGKQRAFPDKLTYYAFGGKFGANKNWEPITQTNLNQIPKGPDMNIVESPLWETLKDQWDFIKTLSEPKNIEVVQKLIENTSPFNN